jgi:hypothetical protein
MAPFAGKLDEEIRRKALPIMSYLLPDNSDYEVAQIGLKARLFRIIVTSIPDLIHRFQARS